MALSFIRDGRNTGVGILAELLLCLEHRIEKDIGLIQRCYRLCYGCPPVRLLIPLLCQLRQHTFPLLRRSYDDVYDLLAHSMLFGHLVLELMLDEHLMDDLDFVSD